MFIVIAKTQQKHVTELIKTTWSISKETQRFMPIIILDLKPPPKLREQYLNVHHSHPSNQKKQQQSSKQCLIFVHRQNFV